MTQTDATEREHDATRRAESVDSVLRVFRQWLPRISGAPWIAARRVELGLEACRFSPGVRSLELGLAADVERLRAAVEARSPATSDIR